MYLEQTVQHEGLDLEFFENVVTTKDNDVVERYEGQGWW